MTQIGDRVIALACTDPVGMTVDLYGAGVYAGEHPRPGYEDVPAEGSEEYSYWAGVVERSDKDNVSIEWSLDVHKRLFEDGKYDQAEYELRCAEARKLDDVERARPMMDRVASVFEGIGKNPRIDLDGGGSVWGFECWWGPEPTVLAKYKDWKWIPRSIEEDRLKYDRS